MVGIYWALGEAKLEKFMKELFVIFFTTIQFTCKSPKRRIAYLDLNFSLQNGLVTTDLDTKSTDCHQYRSIVVPHIQII